jgi:hypothetical protein
LGIFLNQRNLFAVASICALVNSLGLGTAWLLKNSHPQSQYILHILLFTVNFVEPDCDIDGNPSSTMWATPQSSHGANQNHKNLNKT